MDSDHPVGALLREWRKRRGLSQLDLAIQAEVSARHISFVETGRTVPSRAMVLHLAEHLDVPLRRRNRLLVAAGYAPTYQERPLEGPDLAVARDTIRQVLDGHEPYPAMALDRRWNILQRNAAADIFLDGVAPALLEPPVNIMRLGMHPDGFAPRVRNLAEIRGYLLPRLARQVRRTGDPQLSRLHEELASLGPPVEAGEPPPSAVALTVHIDVGGAELRLFSTVTTFGTVFDITLSEIALESYFPADKATAEFLSARQTTDSRG